MYRLILGGHQPEVRYTEVTGEPARASSEVAGYQHWPDDLVIDSDNHIVSYRKHREPEVQTTDKLIEGLMSAYTMALFLGDGDLNGANLAVVETPTAFEAVKIDPEASLSSVHLFPPYGSQTHVYNSLTKPERYDVKEDEGVDQRGVDEGNGEDQRGALPVFSQMFANHIVESFKEEEEKEEKEDDDANDKADKLRDLLHSGPLQKEMFQTVAVLLSTPLEKFHSVIHRCISPEFATSIATLKEAVRRRLETFRAVAESLPGYPEYLAGQLPATAPQTQYTPRPLPVQEPLPASVPPPGAPSWMLPYLPSSQEQQPLTLSNQLNQAPYPSLPSPFQSNDPRPSQQPGSGPGHDPMVPPQTMGSSSQPRPQLTREEQIWATTRTRTKTKTKAKASPRTTRSAEGGDRAYAPDPLRRSGPPDGDPRRGHSGIQCLIGIQYA
jgi:hypothetical protein